MITELNKWTNVYNKNFKTDAENRRDNDNTCDLCCTLDVMEKEAPAYDVTVTSYVTASFRKGQKALFLFSSA